MNFLISVHNRVIPSSFARDAITLKKAKTIINIHLIALLLLGLSIPATIWVEPRFILPFSVTFIGFVLSIWAFKKWHSFELSGNAFIGLCMFCTLSIVLKYGGISSPYVVWLFLIPIYAFIIASRRTAIFWFITTIIAIVGIIQFLPITMDTGLNENHLRIVFAVNTLSFFAFIFFMEYYSDRQRTELIEELQIEKQQNNAIIERLPAGVAYISKDMRVLYQNPVFEAWFRSNNERDAGKHLKELIGESYYQETLPYYERALQGETVNFERLVGDPNKRQIYIRCTYVPRFDIHGKIIGFIVLTEDLTQFKLAEQLKLEVQKAEQEELKVKLNFRNRELASRELLITQQKSLLSDIKTTIVKLKKIPTEQNRNTLNGLIQTINQQINLADEWSSFKEQFERIHPNFIQKLKKAFPNLTYRDLRHCSYIRMNLSNKEIARIQNITLKSVEMTNYRIKKKLNLVSSQKLGDFVRLF